jgi:hypothetical protein
MSIALRLALILASSGLPLSATVGKDEVLFACPSVLATTVDAGKYSGWSIFSNDPLRLTGVDIELAEGDDDAPLEPDETKYLNDEDGSVVQIFRLTRRRTNKQYQLVCHYGEHAQLSRALPASAVECSVVQRQQLVSTEYEFGASCK